MANNTNKIKEEEVLHEVVEQSTSEENSGASDFVNKNKTILLGALGIAILAIVGIVGWKSFNGSKNEEAENEMYQAVYYFEKDSFKLALDGDNANSGFLTVIDKYGSTDVGNQAKYYAGVSYLQLGQTEEGVKYLKSFSKGNNFVSAAAYMALGFAHEDLGKGEEAAEYFEQAANTSSDKDDQFKPKMLQLAGMAYEEAGKKDKALKLYKEIKEKYPLSQEAGMIDKYIGRATNE